MGHFVAVALLDELTDGALRRVEVEGMPLCLCRVGGEVFALKDECSHQRYPLSDGELEGYVLTCSAHGARFDVRSGRVLRPPAFKPVRTYPVRLRDGRVEVEV